MRLIGTIIILLVLGCGLITFGLVPGVHMGGIGSHDERIGDYQVRLPSGWSVLPALDVDGEIDPTVTPENRRGIFVQDWFGANLVISIVTPELLAKQAESYYHTFKREQTFPKVEPGYNASITPVSYITIDEIPFKKAYWSAKGTDLFPPESRTIIRGPIPTTEVIMGFEFRSVPLANRDVICCEAFSLNRTSLNHAEEIVLSLKRKQP